MLPHMGRLGSLGVVLKPLGGGSGILDQIATAAVAGWETFNLTDSYTGPHFELREDFGNTLDDFTTNAAGVPLNGSGQTVAAWLTATGGTNAFCRTLYDQVGANDLTQTTNAAQPLYVASGLGSKPAFNFDGTDDFIENGSIAAFVDGTDTPHTTLVAASSDDIVAADEAIWGFGRSTSTNPIWRFFIRSGGIENFELYRRDDGGGAAATFEPGNQDAADHIHTMIFAGTAADVWLDGTKVGDDESLDEGAFTIDRFALGCLPRTTEGNFYDGDISGMILFDSAVAESQIDTLRAAYMAEKGIS